MRQLHAERAAHSPSERSPSSGVEALRLVEPEGVVNGVPRRDRVVGDDRIVRHGLRDLERHALPRHRRVVPLRAKLLLPRRTPSPRLLVQRGRPALRGLTRRAGHAGVQRFGEIGQRDLRVGDDADLRPLRRAHLRRVGVDMDQLGIRPEVVQTRLREHVVPGRHLADEQDRVGLVDRLFRLGIRQSDTAAELRMALRKVELRVHDRRMHGAAQQLCDSHGLFGRARLRDPVADNHQGIRRLGQDARRLLDSLSIGRSPVIALRRGENVHVRLVVHGVGREPHKRRPGRRRLRLVERPAQEERHLLGVRGLSRPLGELLDHRRQVGALVRQFADVLVPRRDDHRRAALARVVQQADRVGQPGLDVEIQKRRLARRPPVRVSHPDRDALLRHQHVLQVGIALDGVHHRALARPRIPEDVLDALGPQHLHHRVLPGHYSHANVTPFGELPALGRERVSL